MFIAINSTLTDYYKLLTFNNYKVQPFQGCCIYASIFPWVDTHGYSYLTLIRVKAWMALI